jgi:hypothetical protein
VPEIAKTEMVPEVTSLADPWFATKRNLLAGSAVRATGNDPAFTGEPAAPNVPSPLIVYAVIVPPALAINIALPSGVMIIASGCAPVATGEPLLPIGLIAPLFWLMV